jgi:hypothetical protein
MAHPTKSFTDMSLKVVAVRTANNSDFQFEFPASGPLATTSALTTPLALPLMQRLDLLVETSTWHHGGINE